jgi:hypothetical protein
MIPDATIEKWITLLDSSVSGIIRRRLKKARKSGNDAEYFDTVHELAVGYWLHYAGAQLEYEKDFSAQFPSIVSKPDWYVEYPQTGERCIVEVATLRTSDLWFQSNSNWDAVKNRLWGLEFPMKIIFNRPYDENTRRPVIFDVDQIEVELSEWAESNPEPGSDKEIQGIVFQVLITTQGGLETPTEDSSMMYRAQLERIRRKIEEKRGQHAALVEQSRYSYIICFFNTPYSGVEPRNIVDFFTQPPDKRPEDSRLQWFKLQKTAQRHTGSLKEYMSFISAFVVLEYMGNTLRVDLIENSEIAQFPLSVALQQSLMDSVTEINKE